MVRVFWAAAAVVILCLSGSSSRADASVFRDRAAFNSASQNLRTIDFESVPANFGNDSQIDGVSFHNLAGAPGVVSGPNGKMLFAGSVGEITFMTVFLPPGTTAVGCDQFNTPMILSISGESVTMIPSDSSTFVGFVSDQPIQTLTISLDFPEPTPNALIDNLSFGQRRAGNEPPAPQLLLTNSTGRAVALDSVTKESEPFHVLSSRNLSADGHTRLTIFIVGVLLVPDDLSFVTARAEDAQLNVFNLPVEATARVKNLSWMSQVTVRLPDTLAGAGNVNISVGVRGVMSNQAPIRIDQ